MKQTKQFLRPLLMATVMLVGMLVPQGAWAEELRVSSGQTKTITRDANYEVIIVSSGATLIIEEGVSVSATATGYIQADGTVINYGTINGIAVYEGATFANHGDVSDNIFANGGTIYNTGTYVNKSWNNIDAKITPCEHTDCSEVTVEATCTHAGGMQTKCDVCHYIKSFVEGEDRPALGHSFNNRNGIKSCTRCGLTEYIAPELVEGYYQIANMGNLYWFANKVNNDYKNFKNANAKLTADIVVNDITFDNNQDGPQGGQQEQSNAIAWPGIGNLLRDTNDHEEGPHEEGDDRIKGYEGIFDGQGHTISGLYSRNGAAGLVEVSAGNCIIKNVGIVNSYFLNGTIGVICTVCADNTEISNCYSNAICKGDYIGGIVGILLSNQASIKNCYSTSTLSSFNDYDDRTGGIVGEISIDDGSIPSGDDESTALGANISNCYTTYKQICSNATGTNCEASVSADRFASGEIAWLLNDGKTDGTQKWYQKLGENGDSYPVLAATEGKTVYYGYENCLSESKTYSNDLRYAEKEDAHVWTEGRCDNCGQECEHEFVQRENDDSTSHVCKICGIDTDHDWSNGKCTVCDYVCQHPEYSYINDVSHLCTVCQQYGENHKWGADECCTVCRVASTGETYCATVTIGENTKNFIHVESAVAAAMEADEATVVLLSNCNFGGTGISLTKGNITLDLNSKTLSAYGSFVIHVNGCSLTITDNSEDKTGAVRGVGGGVTVVSGSITIHEGTLYASQSSCLNIDANVTAQIDGGRFYTGHEYSNAIYTNGVAALAPDYAYYITDTETQVVVDENGNIPAKDVTVKKAEEGSESTESNYVATVTIGETTTGYAFFQDAVAAAKDASSATICLCKDVSTSYIFFDKGNVTLDLNGKTLSNPNGSTIEVQGGSLTIIDSSEEKTGMLQNGGRWQSSTITATSGSLTIYAGTFNSPSMSALSVSPVYGSAALPTVTVYGGHFISRSYAAISADSPIALGHGYAYYNTETENETILNNIAYGLFCDADGNLVQDITVKESPATMTLQVKDASGEDVVLTKGEDGTYSTIQTIKLTDAGFASLYEFTASSVNYNRDLTALTGSDWGTLCLPFDIPYNAAAGVTFYTLASATNESVTLTAITSGNIEAGTPLLFKRGSETDKLGLNFTTPTMLKTSIASGSSADGLTLKGTFTSKTVYSGYYLDANSGKLHSIQTWYNEKSDGLTIPAFRAWLDGNVSSEAKALNIIIDDEEVTAIDALNAFIQGKTDIYGLDGQKRSDLQKGINIVNGKKVVVK